MQNISHLHRGKMVSNTHAGTGSKGKEILMFFCNGRIRGDKTLRPEFGWVTPKVFIPVQTIEKRNNDGSARNTKVFELIIG